MTLRPVSVYMESILQTEFSVLDHGFIRPIDYMGDESAICQAARVSYGTGTKSVNEDRGLIRYLMRHKHTTPMEMCELKVHVKLPIFVMRQWIRHRMSSTNEYSARYSVLDKEYYVPETNNLALQSTVNRQGRAETISTEQALAVQKLLIADAEYAYGHYQTMLDDGIARELARMNLSLNFYTQFYWKIDLHNLLHFIGLRSDAHAQYEIRVYSDILRDIVKGWMPNVAQAFEDYHPNMNAVLLSGPEWATIKRVLQGELAPHQLKSSLSDKGISEREWKELFAKINRN